jgi:hypothetical protein
MLTWFKRRFSRRIRLGQRVKTDPLSPTTLLAFAVDGAVHAPDFAVPCVFTITRGNISERCLPRVSDAEQLGVQDPGEQWRSLHEHLIRCGGNSECRFECWHAPRARFHARATLTAEDEIMVHIDS